jgi:hypothetical protein
VSERFTTDSAALCGDIKATSFRVYRVLQSLADSRGNVTVSVNELRRLVPGPNGKPSSSLSWIRDALRELSSVRMVTKRSGEPVTTSSRPAATDLPLEMRLRSAPSATEVTR